MKTKTYYVFRVDIWDDSGDSIVEHVAGVDDLEGSGRVPEKAYPRDSRRLLRAHRERPGGSRAAERG
jgi:hypothetical protein